LKTGIHLSIAILIGCIVLSASSALADDIPITTGFDKITISGSYSVQVSGYYTISVFGAKGGNGGAGGDSSIDFLGSSGGSGGLGDEIGGTMFLKAGDVLLITVGTAGGDGGNGGNGSSIQRDNKTVLGPAGGGGGGGSGGATQVVFDRLRLNLLTASGGGGGGGGSGADPSSNGTFGAVGLGGSAGSGFDTLPYNGSNGIFARGGAGGMSAGRLCSFLLRDQTNVSVGASGASGGGTLGGNGGVGGCSYYLTVTANVPITVMDVFASSAVNSGDGFVVITTTTPEPSSLYLLGAGVLGLVLFQCRKRVV
jgi:hypothetical protein